MTGKEALICLAIKHKGDWQETINSIRGHEHLDEKESEEIIKGFKGQCVTLLDKDYPPQFKQSCIQPPVVLFYKGDISIIQNEKKCISITGSRDATTYGIEQARKFGEAVAKKGFILVNGIRSGNEENAMDAFLESGGKGVAVLGSGIDLCYPQTSQKLYDKIIANGGLIISEYPNDLPPEKENLPKQNRIIASLCHSLLITEASKHSDVLITVGDALGMTKEIGCVPHKNGEESACNILIKDGTWLIEDADDVCSMMN